MNKHTQRFGIFRNKFPEKIKAEILKGLPGSEAQQQMWVSHRVLKDLPQKPGHDTLEAAVLIPLYPVEETIKTVFMQRPEYNGVHGGQISFPGGRRESSDNDLVETALREAVEEVGIDQNKIRVISTLTPLFIPVSDMLVTPVVGWIDFRPDFKCQAEEVVFLIEADLKKFLDPSIIRTKLLEVRGDLIDIRYFAYKNYVIWGATAMILNELLTIIKRALKSGIY